MTELDFLLELLLNHKLPKATQLTIKDRISVVQAPRIVTSGFASVVGPATTITMPQQLDSTMPQSPVVAQALAERQRLMSAGGVLDKGQKSPRKF